MFFLYAFRFIISITILTFIGFGLVDYLKNIDENECSMTYMRHYPNYIPVNLPYDISKQFSNYKLYYYCEGYDCQKYESLKFKEPGDIPVLFITGNADSHGQVRSLASIAMDKSNKLSKNNRKKFHFFTISFNEELSALYGPILNKQTNYAKYSIKHILTLFNQIKPDIKRPKTVLVVGNSMGGVVARNLFIQTEVEFDTNLVHTVITQATPHNRPVINFDQSLNDFYEKLNNFWLNETELSLNNVVLASSYGGNRDILVRSGLSNINEWRSKSQSSIISSYTLSMPYVWRSIDHRCMAWCRELIMAINRAIFDLVDSNTQQIHESKIEREKVLRYHFERDVYASNDLTLIKLNGELVNINNPTEFELNNFNDLNKKIYSINLETINNNFDSLFLYTNLNHKQSFLLCEKLEQISNDELNCLNYKDLMIESGRTIPPYFEHERTETSLKTINFNFNNKNSQKFLLIQVPVWKKLENRHQLILKLDWYNKKDRVKVIDPKLDSYVSIEQNQVYFRYYLNNVNKIIDTFDLEKITQNNSCDSYLIKKASNSHPPLSNSCLMIQFYEPVNKIQKNELNEQIIHSQAIQRKTKTIQIKLSVNHDSSKSLTPFIQTIKFDLKHLIHHSFLDKDLQRNDETNYKIKICFNFKSLLGQIVRFYFVFIPAFIACILELYDFLIIFKSNIKNESFLILDKFQLSLWYHLSLSLFLIVLNYLKDTIVMKILFIRNDYEKLDDENINLIILPFILYWCSYAIVGVVCVFLSLTNTLLGFMIKNILFKLFKFLTSFYMKIFIEFFFLILILISGVYCPTLAHCCIFYGEIIRFVLSDKQNLKSQTRLLFTYLILILNLPGLIVWIKSINNNNNSIQPMFLLFNDYGLVSVCTSILITILNRLKLTGYLEWLKLNSELISSLVFINLIFTVLYSTLSLYRLQYFILAHLVLMILHSSPRLETKSKND